MPHLYICDDQTAGEILMRIITGKSRGLKLAAPAGLDVRPTADRVKEALFNILNPRILGSKVVDIFSGSGNLGLEAWSRGAAEVVCVDNSASSLKYIRQNIEKAKAADQVKIYPSEALKSIEEFSRKDCLFDIVFCDPPYDRGWGELILNQIKKYNILEKNGILVLEHSKNEEFLIPEGLFLLRSEKYGETKIAFFGLTN